MLPLGDWWTGDCHAAPEMPRPSSGAGCEAACNLGYARGQCPWFPNEVPGREGPDAVRFAISRRESGLVRISYVTERDHHPFERGEAEYALGGAGLVIAPPGATLRRQVLAYLESYLRRTKEV